MSCDTLQMRYYLFGISLVSIFYIFYSLHILFSINYWIVCTIKINRNKLTFIMTMKLVNLKGLTSDYENTFFSFFSQ